MVWVDRWVGFSLYSVAKWAGGQRYDPKHEQASERRWCGYIRIPAPLAWPRSYHY